MIQENIDQIKEQFQHPLIQKIQINAKPNQGYSEFLQQYLNFFGKAYTPIIKPQDIFLQQLKSHKIIYDNEQYFCSTPLVKVVSNSLRYQFLTIEVKIGYFTFCDLNIANINAAFPSRLANPEGWGSFGSVYKILFRDDQLALKVTFLSFNSQSNRDYQRELSLKAQLIIKQFCMTKLASALGVGPAISGKMGFDILFYKDCIAYSMQYCQNDNYNQSFQCSQNSLKQKLLIMHSFKFIHLDIKDNNICYSKTRKQFVYIDFGLSIIIPEKLGHKAFTKYFGTANYCSEAMSKLMTVQEGGFVDLYHNDVCCLRKVFNLEKSDSWKIDQQPINVDHFYKKEESNSDDYDRYERAVMASYLKFLVYKLQFSQFQLLMQPKMRLLKSLDLGNVYNFIKNMNFSSRFLTISPQIISSAKYLSREVQGWLQSTFSVDQDEIFGKIIFDFMENHNNEESKHENKRLLKSIKDRQILLKEGQIQKLDYKIYIRLLLEVIQVNVNSSSWKQKFEYCSVAKKVFEKMQGQIFKICSIVENNSRNKSLGLNEFQKVSLILFFYSLQGKMDSVKIIAFHSMIYNVVLLQLLNLESLLQCYRRVQRIKMSLQKKMHMILKFKTTLHWKYFQVSQSFNDRIQIIEKIKQLNGQFQQEIYHSLSGKKYEFMKIINISTIYNTRQKDIKFVENILNQVLQGEFQQFLKDDNFKNELIIWLICNIVRGDSFSQHNITRQKFVFQQSNKRQLSFQYYHFQYLFFQNNRMFDITQSSWIVELFLKLFEGTFIASLYCMQYFRQILYLQKSRFQNYREFLHLIKSLDISKIGSWSVFGKILSQTLIKIIQGKSLNNIPLQVRSIYSEKYMGKLLTYEYVRYEQVAGVSMVWILVNMLKQQFYISRILCNKDKVNTFLRVKFREVYLNLSQRAKKIKYKENMNNSLIGLMTINVYILFRNEYFKQMLNLMNCVFTCFNSINELEQLQIYLKPFIYFFFLRLACTLPVKKGFLKGQYITIYQQYYKYLKRKHLYRHLLDDQFFLIEVFTFILYQHPQQLADFINIISYELFLMNSHKNIMVYFEAIQKIYLCGVFMKKLEKVNLQYVFSRLQDTSLNPYNVIYLHFSMRYDKLWSHQRIIQISTSLNLVNQNVKNLIQTAYYKYFIIFYSRKLTQRKKTYLLFMDAKYGNQKSNQDSCVNYMFRPFISSKSWQTFKSYSLRKNFEVIKSKLSMYFLAINHPRNLAGSNQQEQQRKIPIRLKNYSNRIGKLSLEITNQR